MLRSKHVKLTQACYPKSKTAAAKPNSSELQYLVYYASSRPKKLIKVGAYIRQKVSNYGPRNRQTEIVVSLDICTALIERCHSSLNLFLTDVVAIIQSALRTKDSLIVTHAGLCFTILCKYHDGSALGTDATYTKSYEHLLGSFRDLACTTDDSANDELRITGARALEAACSSAAMQAPNMLAQLHIIVPGVLANLMKVKEEALYSLRKQAEKQLSELAPEARSSLIQSTTPHSLATPQEKSAQRSTSDIVQLSALDSVRQLFASNDAMQIRSTTSEILQHVCVSENFSIEWSSTILQIAAEWAPLDLRFHVLAVCLQQLEQCDTTRWPTVRQNHLLYIINAILVSRVNLIGLSTSDVLDSLLTAAAKSLQCSDQSSLAVLQSYFSSSGVSSDAIGPQVRYLQSISNAIVAISAHSYYKNQVPDMLETILNSIQSITSHNDLGTNVLKLLQLNAALQLIRNELTGAGTAQSGHRLPISVFGSSLPALHNQTQVVRLSYLEILCLYFSREPRLPEKQQSSEGPREVVLRRLETSLYHSLKKFSEPSTDLEHFMKLFTIICGSLAQSEIIRFLPFVYRLDRDFAESSEQLSNSSARKSRICQRLLSAIAIACGDRTYASEVTEAHGLPELELVLERLTTNHQIYVAADKRAVMLQPWSPEAEAGGVDRATSLKHSSRSRLASSANASYENIGAIGSANQNRNTTSRVEDLRRLLLQPKVTQPAARERDPKVDLNDLFHGLELRSWSGDEQAISVTAQSTIGLDPSHASSEKSASSMPPVKEFRPTKSTLKEDNQILGPVIS